jgi:hypothetical protein
MFVSSKASMMTCPRILLSVLCLGIMPSQAVLFYDTADSNHNTTAPTGIFQDSGWQYEGLYGAYLGTMIAPQYFITAQHFGTQGTTFTQSGIFNGGSDVTYNIDTHGQQRHRLLGHRGHGPAHLQGAGELFELCTALHRLPRSGLTMVTMGRGGPRGADVLVGGDLHGWEHSSPDGTARWGSNTVSGVYASALGDLLMAGFSASGTAEEATLSNGDSGGGVFVNDGGVWKLAGVNYSIDGQFDTNNTVGDGSEFDAALFDRGGLYQGSDAFGWTFIPDLPLDNPSNMYASRISTNAASIMSIAVVPEPHSALLVLLAAFCGLAQRRRFTTPV